MSEAAQAEAEGVETAHVSWRGVEFDVPRYRRDWPFDAVVAVEEEKWPLVLRYLLPDLALAEFRALRPTETDAMDLINEISNALGFADKGE